MCRNGLSRTWLFFLCAKKSDARLRFLLFRSGASDTGRSFGWLRPYGKGSSIVISSCAARSKFQVMEPAGMSMVQSSPVGSPLRAVP